MSDPYGNRRVGDVGDPPTQSMHGRARTLQTIYPEVAVGGFSRVDGVVNFYQRVNAVTKPNDIVLDIGAGRGRNHIEDPSAYRRHLMSFKGRVGKVIGIDVDDAVLGNPSLDEARLIVDGRFDLPDSSVDVAFADWVFEHVDDPAVFAAEAFRVLRRGGWLCARTPNKYGYVSVASRLIPEALHERALRWAQPHRQQKDVFPAHYRLNTKRDLQRVFTPEQWSTVVYSHTNEPAYFGNSPLLWRIAKVLFWLTPPSMGAHLHIFMQKRA